MKNLILIILIVIFTSCISKKSALKEKEPKSLVQLKLASDTLTTEEKNIVNDFLDVELASERYKNDLNREIIVIEEASNGIENLEVYEYAYKRFHEYGAKPTTEVKERLGWILDTIQIKGLKNNYGDKKQYHWRSSDIKNFKVNIMTKEVFTNSIRSGEYITLPERLIIYITKPLLVDSTTAFTTFRTGSSRLGFTTINNYTALMNKVNGKWLIRASYWDGSIE
jgi:hypothetical protein